MNFDANLFSVNSQPANTMWAHWAVLVHTQWKFSATATCHANPLRRAGEVQSVLGGPRPSTTEPPQPRAAAAVPPGKVPARTTGIEVARGSWGDITFHPASSRATADCGPQLLRLSLAADLESIELQRLTP